VGDFPPPEGFVICAPVVDLGFRELGHGVGGVEFLVFDGG
jgi:hypothetical protein